MTISRLDIDVHSLLRYLIKLVQHILIAHTKQNISCHLYWIKSGSLHGLDNI